MKNTKNIEHFHHFINTKSFSDSSNKIQKSQKYSPNIFTPFPFNLAMHTRSHRYHKNCQNTCYTRYRIISSDKPGDPETLQNHSVGAIKNDNSNFHMDPTNPALSMNLLDFVVMCLTYIHVFNNFSYWVTSRPFLLSYTIFPLLLEHLASPP